MRAVILAAGRGTRLNGHASDAPKALLPIGGLTMIDRQIRALRETGVDEVAVVVGCRAEEVRRRCGPGVAYVENTAYARTNSLYSLWLARDLLRGGCLVLNCDVLFHPQLLADLITARHECALLVAYRDPSAPPFGDEEMKVRVRGGRVQEMGKTLGGDADAENVGIARFDAPAIPALTRALDAIVTAGGDREWAPRAFAAVAAERPVWAIGTRGFPWIEVDFPEDYDRALAEILPLIDADAPARHSRPADTAAGGRGLVRAANR